MLRRLVPALLIALMLATGCQASEQDHAPQAIPAPGMPSERQLMLARRASVALRVRDVARSLEQVREAARSLVGFLHAMMRLTVWSLIFAPVWMPVLLLVGWAVRRTRKSA